MADTIKRKLQLVTIVYWVLLVYIIAALIWWALSLIRQSEDMYGLKKANINILYSPSDPVYQAQSKQIEEVLSRDRAKYIGEGGTFLLLILLGAVFVYRSVRRQFRLQQQQQNFVMAITHELKTPIAVSRLNLETLQKYELDQQRKQKLLQMTLQENLRLDTLINNILISAQLEGDSYTPAREDIDLSSLTRDIAAQFCYRYPERKVEHKIEEGIELVGDPLLLKLLVSNLLENAQKYSPKDQPIVLELSSGSEQVMLMVKDFGTGIAEDEKKKIFTKFYRIGSEQTRKTQGTGLGLYLCKKIAKDHGATILVRDNTPQGSTFIVQFSDQI
jgi:two-component system, OmpR family, sensor histidine kinase CiaH